MGEILLLCIICWGDGRVKIKNKKIKLKILVGVDDGSRLWVWLEGNVGCKGGFLGDVYVFIKVKLDLELKRNGNDIFFLVKVFYIDVILGIIVKVFIVDGIVDLKILVGI